MWGPILSVIKDSPILSGCIFHALLLLLILFHRVHLMRGGVVNTLRIAFHSTRKQVACPEMGTAKCRSCPRLITFKRVGIHQQIACRLSIGNVDRFR
ncbi:hypothetical protein CDAR_212991 [Caerostris darwini]|uniref:Secreted protein n=1 Tax=Caerostris darwini TaxID=1538125 RepID=A0AAV4UBR5_9ARAC|nr:hypothetical protein CDAR_212991 [Caerostris darwini]